MGLFYFVASPDYFLKIGFVDLIIVPIFLSLFIADAYYSLYMLEDLSGLFY